MPPKNTSPTSPATPTVPDIHLVTSLKISDLDLVDYAAVAAQQLLAQFPSIIFTSGRRNAAQQARAMAPNIVKNRNWIADTYAAGPEENALQSWVNANPGAKTAAAISAGLLNIMNAWSDDQKKTLSRHFSGQAFDIQPVAGAGAAPIKAAIRKLPNLRHFFENEGGLIIWHADFEK